MCRRSIQIKLTTSGSLTTLTTFNDANNAAFACSDLIQAIIISRARAKVPFAISETDLPSRTRRRASCAWSILNLRGRPNCTPLFWAASRPALVRSRMRSRSNSPYGIPTRSVAIAAASRRFRIHGLRVVTPFSNSSPADRVFFSVGIICVASLCPMRAEPPFHTSFADVISNRRSRRSARSASPRLSG